jgi:hypothetical protein
MAEANNGNMTPTEKMQKQYDRLIAARNYHYDNLNKWLMSFYVIIGALFVAFYSVKSQYQIIIAAVGYVVSLSAWLSAKGYSYWENIWIEKIQRFEKNILKFPDEMLVYSNDNVDTDVHNNLFRPFKGANISTTKVAIFMTAFVTIAWGFLVMMLLFNIKNETERVLVAMVMSIVLSYLFMIVGTKLLPSIEKKEEKPQKKIKK